MIKHLPRIICLLTLVLLAAIHPGWSQSFKDGVRPGLIKVKFATSMTEAVSRMQINARRGGLSTGITSFDVKARLVKASNMYRLFPFDAEHESKLRKHGMHLWYVVEFDETIDPRVAANHFAQLPEIARAEIEKEKVISPYKVEVYQPGVATFSSLPFNDPLLKDQWHYDNTKQTGFGDADINLFKAWETTTGAGNIIVSVHDEGVDVSHEDLKENIWVNPGEIVGNGVDDDANGYIDDVNGFNFAKNKGAVDAQFHGTHVAGTIAAMNNNGKGVCGIAGGDGSGNGVKVMSLQILGGGLIERSYVYAANNGAVISQNSWGYTTEGYIDESVRDAIHYFIAEAGNYEGSPMRGGIVIFAAGNSNSDGVWYPGWDESILSVSAIGPEWKKAAYSNYGKWVEISAPGGDQINYPGKNGVLSTIPDDKYAYIQGTSMACPHVSGTAALVLANRDKQLTPQDVWERLVTGVTSIDDHNTDFIGKLGSGALDASLAIQNDEKMSPDAITDLKVTGMAQEFATLSWTVPADGDDDHPSSFTLYYHTHPLSGSNLSSASKLFIKNNSDAGTTFHAEVTSLVGLTTYYFAVTSTDRWGNTSVLSNPTSASTNEGPSVAVSPQSISMGIDDAGVSATTSLPLTISNSGAGILRWSNDVRHRSATSSFSGTGIHYPAGTGSPKPKAIVGKQRVSDRPTLKTQQAATSSFSTIEKSLSKWPTDLIGETDLSLPNSAAAKFYVSEPEGFNLTDVTMYLQHDPEKGPVVVEIFKGSAPTKDNLVYAQEYTSWTDDETWAYVTLDEQIYFESGATFWVAFHIPAGNRFPLGIGYEKEPASSTQCFISFDVGGRWQSLEEALNDKGFAWSLTASSYNAFLGTYLTLDPAGADVNSDQDTTVMLHADASALINGTYSANLVLKTNDGENPELRVPVDLTVSGHQPDILYPDIADFGAGFVGEKKTYLIEFDNQGFGNLDDAEFIITGSDFSLEGSTPFSIPAREKVLVPISFMPGSAGSKNATLTVSNGTHTYTIMLTGVGAETSEISLSPESQSVDDLAIGDEVTAYITVENTGAYPLKYFIPGHDSGVGEGWPTPYHKYGYALRSNGSAEANPIAYEFQDISATGVDITDKLIQDDVYVEVDMGFTFPYYGEMMKKIFIAQKGFTTFDNSVRPVNTPTLNNINSPGGYISPLGTFLTFIAEGKIFYQLLADRLIIQYHQVTDGSMGYITVQMVLHVNGDIRFFYEDMGYSTDAQQYLNILIEGLNKQDGILAHNYEKSITLFNGFALGFDYPGPDIISSVTNGSGILAPGTSADVEVHLNTTTLSEGETKRYINFISNDPGNMQKNALVTLNITSGGVPNPVVSHTTIDFGNVFQGAVCAKTITIKNEGTANAEITSMTLANSLFTIEGDIPATIKPGLFSNYTITMPTVATGLLVDVLTIEYAHATQTINLTGDILDPPGIAVDLTPINENINYGDSIAHPFSIQNTGLADLEVSTVGTQWMSFRTSVPAASNSYNVEKHNSGGVYQWIDIRKTGVQMPFADDLQDASQYWRDLTLPFAFEYFGNTYTKLKIGENGILSFEADPEVMMFSDSIPSAVYEGAYIMPYWSFAGFNTVFFPKEDVGIFYQRYDDKVIITWSFLINYFGGMGDPVSAQVILFKNGMMKFQYKVEENGSDETSIITLIGLQRNSAEAIDISSKLALDHGMGLAYTILPAKKHIVAPGETLNGEIFLTAKHTYGGIHDGILKIYSNVPGSELLEKPAQLTINGEGTLNAADFAFGKKVIDMAFGSAKTYSEEVAITNSGTAPLDISWIETASGGTQFLGLQVFTLVDGWFGPTWEWADISQLYSSWYWPNPVFTLMPGDQLKARAIFSPEDLGDFQDEIVFTTSVGEGRMLLTATAIEPPSIAVETESISVAMKTMNEVATKTIVFNNLEGKSDLEYTVSIDFNRSGITRTGEQISTSSEHSLLKMVKVEGKSGIHTSGTYHRELRHTSKHTPENHVGTGGSAPFTVATKFNAGNEGFLLSHIETWFRAEGVKEGNLEVEVRAGGTSISDASTLTKEKVSFSRSGTDENGNWEVIALKNAVRIYPNEHFYVIVTYPLGIEFPQGIVANEPTTPSRYFYYDTGVWFDLQQESGFTTSAWLMYAGEIEAGTTSWLSISSPLAGSLAPGEQTSLSLSIEGAYAQRGDQGAYVIINSNDQENNEVQVPVALHMNEAPRFVNAPHLLSVAENDTLVVSMNIMDAEDDSVSASAIASYPHLKLTLENNVLTLVLTPDYSSAGTYEYSFKATDEWGAATEVKIPLEILHSNQAPQYIGTEEMFELMPTAEVIEYQVSAYFKDPDNDPFKLSALSDSTEIAEVFTAADKFLLRPRKPGETSVHFTVTDINGAVTIKTLPVKVNVILSAEMPHTISGVKIFPNPVEHWINLQLSSDWGNQVMTAISDVSGHVVLKSQVLVIGETGASINVSHLSKGIYLLEVSSANKRTVIKLMKK